MKMRQLLVGPSQNHVNCALVSLHFSCDADLPCQPLLR